MNISFTCANCSRAYSVSESLAGKKALCKDCGTEFRVPMSNAKARPATAPEPLPPPLPSRKSAQSTRQSADRFGFEDLPAPKPRYEEVEEEIIHPRRAPATYKENQRRSRSSGDGGEAANQFCFAGFWGFVAAILLSILVTFGVATVNDGGSYWQILYLVVGAIGCLSIMGMSVGIIIALVNLIRFREFPDVGIGGGIIWVLAFLFTPFAGYNMIQGGINGYRNAMAKQNGQAGPPGIPQQVNAPPGFDQIHGNPPNFGPPPEVNQPPAFQPNFGPPRQEVRVALSDGQISRRTTNFGVNQPGFEFRVSYNIETGRAMGEKYVLMIKTGKTQGKLTTFNLRGSGTISGFSPIASIDEGPFEAWMELEAFGGRNSRRVSDTISLRVVDVPQAQPQNNPPPGLPNGFGNRPGMPPMGPRSRGGRGFPGGRP